jgi:MFS transporter, Spinster family, sphingosine-1-phosphate transporter
MALKATKTDMDGEETVAETTALVEGEAPESKGVPNYSWFVLAILVCIRVIY